MSIRSSLLSAVSAFVVFAATYQPALAVTGSTYTVQGNVYRVVEFAGADSNEIRLSTVVKGAAANDAYAARVVPLRVSKFSGWFKPQIGSIVRGNAWWAAFAATIAAAGWAIDELRNQVVSDDPYAIAGQVWYPDYHKTEFSATSDEALLYYCKTYTAGTNCQIVSRKVLASDRLGASRISYEFKYTNASGVAESRSWRTYRTNCSDESSTVSSCGAGFTNKKPVTDADLNAAVISQMEADPAYAATAFTNPATGRPYDDLFEPVPYIPGLSAADEALVNCYISGQLQMVNSQTACYVATQAEYDRVKQQAEALAAGRTPQGEADSLNETMKQPLTQAQYEETNKKYSDAVADVTADVNAKNDSDYSDVDDKFNELDGIITDLPNTSLPAPAHLSVPQYVDCQQLTLSDGNGHELVFPSQAQCAKIETFKQGFGYFLAISVVFLLCMQLLTRPHG